MLYVVCMIIVIGVLTVSTERKLYSEGQYLIIFDVN